MFNILKPFQNIKNIRLLVILFWITSFLFCLFYHFTASEFFLNLPPCPYQNNGFLCPACGGGHALHAIFSLQFLQAFQYNCIISSLFFAFIIYALLFTVIAFFIKNPLPKLAKLSISALLTVGIFLAISIIPFTLLRNSTLSFQ